MAYKDKEAARAASRRSYRRHRERVIARTTAWSNAHPEVARAAGKKWAKKNAQRELQRSRQRYRDDPDGCRERTRRWRLKNTDAERRRFREWQKANPETVCAHAQKRRALKKGARGSATPAQWIARLDYYGRRCAYCGGAAEVIDHVIPLSRNGTGFASNLRPACKKCNSSKGAKLLSEWQRRPGW